MLFPLLDLLQHFAGQRGLGTSRGISSRAQIVQRVHVAQRNRILRRDGQQLIALPLKIVARIIRNNPVWRTQIARLRARDCLDRVRSAIHVAQHPLLSLFPLRATQYDVAISVVLQLEAMLHQLLRRVEARDPDILLGTPLSPGLRREPPSHHKKCRLDAVAVEHADQPRPPMLPLRTEQDVRPWPVVKSKCYEFVRGRSNARNEKQSEKSSYLKGAHPNTRMIF